MGKKIAAFFDEAFRSWNMLLVGHRQLEIWDLLKTWYRLGIELLLGLSGTYLRLKNSECFVMQSK
jgi:hypothetical protein